MVANPSRRVVIQLEIGTVGYLVGAVAWSLFWLAIARNYVGMWWGHWFSIGFFAVSLSLVMVGIGCFALGKLFSRWPAVITGVVNVIAAVPFFIMGLFALLPLPPWPFRSWHLWYITLIGYGLLIAGMLLWMALTTSEIASSGFRRLGTAIGTTTLVSVIVFLFLISVAAYWGPIAPAILTQPYVLAQVLSAMLLHKIASEVQRKPHEAAEHS